MKIYNVLWEDRHTDVTATPFFDIGKAKEWAKEQAEFACRHKDDLREKDVVGWLYCIEYSCEGDYLWITESEVVE